MIALALMAAAVSAPAPTTLSSVEAAEVVKACEGSETGLAANFCNGYIIGVFDGLSLSHQICAVGFDASTMSAVAASRKYLADHPDEWNQRAAVLIEKALRATFPCRH
jgi:Ssp1 endopeptidase immunity protein Rap1a